MIVSETWQTINDHFVSFLGAIFFSMFLIMHIYSNNKIVSVIIVIKTPAPQEKRN